MHSNPDLRSNSEQMTDKEKYIKAKVEMLRNELKNFVGFFEQGLD